VPKRKCKIPTCEKIWKPSRSRNSRINATTMTAKKAVKKNTVLMVFSFITEKRAMLSEDEKDIFCTIFTVFCSLVGW
jgi:hypothetical protein